MEVALEGIFHNSIKAALLLDKTDNGDLRRKQAPASALITF